ncbi:MAG: hypothetical protein IBJ00_06265, partial [Alphaproteobacteria bacterium]|nr:hypothetical protein [Alphaproteobacteria bacterium]
MFKFQSVDFWLFSLSFGGFLITFLGFKIIQKKNDLKKRISQIKSRAINHSVKTSSDINQENQQKLFSKKIDLSNNFISKY